MDSAVTFLQADRGSNWSGRSAAVPVRRGGRRVVGWLMGLIVFICLVAMVFVGWLYVMAIYWPRTPSGPTKHLTIVSGSSVGTVTKQLTEAGLVRHPLFFELYTRLSGTASHVQAGEFTIPADISGKDLAALLGVAKVDQTSLRFQEGWRMEEMAAYLDSKGLNGLSGSDFLAAAGHPTTTELDQLGVSLPTGAGLEGFLFPDTYLVERGTTAKQLVDKMVAAYRKRVTPEMQAGFKAQGLSEYEAVILASIVEREGRSADDRSVIAGILLKRLNSGIALYADSTIQYGLGYSTAEQRWWRQNLTENDLTADTPFNTRLHAGLPPQPICNPSLEALEAVAQPKQTPYLYYMHGNDGVPHYATTLDEHNANVAKYLD